MALSQLLRINKLVKKKEQIYKKYINDLRKFNQYIHFPSYENKNGSSYHLFVAHLNFSKLRGNKDKFIKFLNKYNIYPQYHYIPIYRLKNMKNIIIKNYNGSEKYFKSAISLPIYVNLNNKVLSFVIKKIINYIKKFKKINVQK